MWPLTPLTTFDPTAKITQPTHVSPLSMSGT
jgi:hypothetical protein